MPELTSAALFEKDGKALLVHRRRPPLAGQWLLPMARVPDSDTAEEVLHQHAREQFGVGIASEEFVDTVYITDPDDRAQYVANIFRAEIDGGPMRFNAEGDYDDARWLAPEDIEQLWMPPDLRIPLLQILTNPGALHETDWSRLASEQAVPLGEVGSQPPMPEADEGPPPDNIAGWNTIAEAYQRERRGDRDAGRLQWSLGLFDDELHVLGDIRGQRALAVGCGGGQDVVALDRMGAVAVGIDPSSKQIEYAKRYAQRHDATNAAFIEGRAEDLTRFDDASFDLVVSIHALGYVTEIEAAIAEMTRVLKPGGVLAISISHPFGQMFDDGSAGFCAIRSYWDDYVDWDHWRFEGVEPVMFRENTYSIGEWHAMLVAAGFNIERIIEPRQDVVAESDAINETFRRRAAMVPYVLIIKARKQ